MQMRTFFPLSGVATRRGSALLAALLVLFLAAGCSNAPSQDDGRLDLSFSFEESDEGWTGAFVDYPTAKTAEEMELVFDRRPLPAEVGGTRRALFLAGHNLSDDLFMFLKRRVNGLRPNTTYTLTFALDLASNAPSGCGGIGGPPGESVFLKVGAARVEPEPVVVGEDYRLNVDKNNQAASGENAIVIGNIANGSDQCTGQTPYRLLTRDNRNQPFTISTDAGGVLWLLVGTESGFEGKTALYYDAIRVTLQPR